MTLRGFGDVIIYIGGLAVALTAIAVALRYMVVRPLTRLIDERIEQVNAGTQAVQETADKIDSEMTPNHGQSLKDQVGQTQTALRMLVQRFDDHLLNHPTAGWPTRSGKGGT